MIEVLEHRLTTAIPNGAFLAAMRAGIEQFPAYRSLIPRLASMPSRTLLYKDAEFELVAMQWAPGTVSGIHDHADSRCWVAMLEGTLEVTNFDRLDDGEPIAKLRAADAVRISKGDIDHRLTHRELHSVKNDTTGSAYSLQLYAKPLVTYTVVDEATGYCRQVASRYESVFDLAL